MYEVYGGQLDENIKVIIDGKPVFCPQGSSILEAAKLAGIEIPTLCYLKGLTPTGMCGVCAVEIENEDGTRKIRRACRYRAKDGMVIYTNSKNIDKYRKERMEKLLAIHPQDCLTCHKSNGNCKFQKVANNFADRYNLTVETVKVPKRGTDSTSPAFIREMEKCIACGRCINVCNEVQKIKIYEMHYDNKTGDKYCRIKGGHNLSDTNCINCGQCVKVCPVGALTEKNGIVDALNAIDDPNLTVVWSMAPAIQNTLGEEFGLPTGTDVTRKIAAAIFPVTSEPVGRPNSSPNVF